MKTVQCQCQSGSDPGRIRSASEYDITLADSIQARSVSRYRLARVHEVW